MYDSIGGYGSQFGGQMNNMGQQPVRNDRMGYAPGGMPQQNPGYGQMPAPAPRPMPMPTFGGYGYNPRPGGMPQPNPNYGQLGQGVSNQFGQYGQMGQQIAGHMGGYGGGYGNMGQQINGHMPGYGSMGQQISGQMPFGGEVQPGGIDYLRGQFDGAPQPDTGAVDNPDMQQNPFRTFNNGNPFYNARGNLRMRYR
ncbi:MAG: hypothetical protein EBT13_12635 [Rhodobacteraceae bacterium]|nr:hypothetical protein [Paracoccaceae bacterium]